MHKINNLNKILEKKCLELEKQVEYYKDFAEQVGQKRLREVDQLNRVISERKKTEETLIQNQRLSAMGELAFGIAHDFNNSLQGMFGNIELALLKNIAPEVREEHLKAIKQSATDAASRIQQLERFSGNSKGQDGYIQLNINNIVDSVVSQTRPLWKDESEKTGIAIVVEKNYARNALKVDGNEGELRSVLYNLVKNSIHAMPKGGRLTFETAGDEKGVYVTVTDTGIGMDEKIKTRIFQPFFTTKGFEQGKGLGMSTSYAIVQEHGGELYVKESSPGKGTSITISLPFSKIQESRQQNVVTEYEGSARILWVDDEEPIRNMGKVQLEMLNHRADVAASGEEALSLLQDNQYDLMITDVGMPNMNGWQLVERIKGNHSSMKIVILTGWELDVADKEKEKYGIGYIAKKPIKMAQLKNIVGEVLQLKQNHAV